MADIMKAIQQDIIKRLKRGDLVDLNKDYSLECLTGREPQTTSAWLGAGVQSQPMPEVTVKSLLATLASLPKLETPTKFVQVNGTIYGFKDQPNIHTVPFMRDHHDRDEERFSREYLGRFTTDSPVIRSVPLRDPLRPAPQPVPTKTKGQLAREAKKAGRANRQVEI